MISLKDKFNGSDIYSMREDFSLIAPNKDPLTPEIADEIGAVIKDRPLDEVMALAK
ncbi:MAG: hypothetical protein K2J58_06230 [Muribaculaceae bacterium]|nr:hypothetical protein [Muribaculaceae bacterium]